MIYYKTLNENGICLISVAKWSLPNGKPGEWMPRVENVAEYKSGYHICRKGHLVHWLGANIYTVEVRGRVHRHRDECVAHEVRLICRIESWTQEVKYLVAADFAEHVLYLFERERLDDARPRNAIVNLRRYALGKITTDELSAVACAAGSAAAYAAIRSSHVSAAAGRTAAYSANDIYNTTYVADAAAYAVYADAGVGYTASLDADAAERKWQTKTLFQYLNRPVSESLEIARAKLEAA